MAFDLGAIIAHVTADLSDFKKGMDTARNEAKSFKDGFTDNMKTVGIAAGVATAAITAIGAVTFKLAEEAAQYNTIRDAFQSMTKGIVSNVDEFETRVAKASGNTLDNLTILRGGTRALSLIGKDSFSDFGKQFEEMAMLSKKAARATGSDVNFMFDSLILGVSRSSKMILDNLGINISLEESYDRFAKNAGKAADALTAQEQKAALLQSALLQLHTNYDSVAISAGGLQGGMQILTTEMTNLRVELGQQLEPVFNELIRTLLPLIQEYAPQLILLVQQAIEWFMNLDPPLRNTIAVFIGMVPVVAAVIGIVLGLIAVLTVFLNPIVLVGTAITFLASIFIANWTKISETVKHNVDYVKSLFDSMVDKLKQVGGQIEDAIKEPFNRAWESVKNVVNKIKDALDFTKRHSPSVLDIVKSGVGQVNNALSKLDYGLEVSPHATVGVGMPSSGIGAVALTIDMSGAIISDSAGAMRIAEMMGNKIIQKLNTQVRH